MRKLILAVCLMLIILAPANACDVSLFALVAGNSPNNAFAEKLTGLVSSAKAVGNNSQEPAALPGHLQKLMTSWIEFSNTYLVNPPEWAKNDASWKQKFDELTDLIGSIRKNLSNQEPDQPKAHQEIQKFTRRLTRLYDGLQMNELARLLLDTSTHIDHIWDAWWAQDRQKLVEATKNFSSVCHNLSEKLDEASAKMAENIVHRAGELHKMAAREDVFTGKSFEFMLNMTENDFARFNDARREKTATDSK
ncbi:MAG: hypothetical protein CVV42_03105 [Candidatus Riflebacteria bacterium HGW-Riflebacteria-2]|nr:MAG: hypothetical protein CVV42_03105 [Candidatus Riflebacteria bacterium HGW-Riflebacteria-2]